MADEVLYERRGPVVVVTINRPEARNAINAAVRSAEQAAPPPPLSLLDDVYADPPPALAEQRARLREELDG